MYQNADILREQAKQSPGKPKKFGHFCSATRANCVLLPIEKRRFKIPQGRGAMGQANVCYPYLPSGAARFAQWMKRAVEFVDDYRGSNLLLEPVADAEAEVAAATEAALARSKGQGFARSLKQRQAIEGRAMKAASNYFRNKGFKVEDVSTRRPYDLLCIRKTTELHVEVKGTTTQGQAIILTKNEVEHACNPKHSCVLFVLHTIMLSGNQATGGKANIIAPWTVRAKHLKPICYTYALGAS